MNTQPISEYLQAAIAYKEGNKEEALELLASSLGVEEPTQIMRENLDKFIDMNQAALVIILHRSQEV